MQARALTRCPRLRPATPEFGRISWIRAAESPTATLVAAAAEGRARGGPAAPLAVTDVYDCPATPASKACCFMAASGSRSPAAIRPGPSRRRDPLLCGPAGRRDLLRPVPPPPPPGCVVPLAALTFPAPPPPPRPAALGPAPLNPPDKHPIAASTTDASSVLPVGLIGPGPWQRSRPPIRGRRAVGLGGRPFPPPPTRRLVSFQGVTSGMEFCFYYFQTG